MMYIAMNRFRIAPDKQEAFKARWLDREVLLRTVPGFISFQFLKGPEREDHVLYASHTVWASEDAFINWTKSEQFRQAHATAGDGVKLETRKNRVISGEVGWLDDVEVAGRTKGASFGLISMMSGVDSAGFADLQTESACGF